ncbi:MAG: VWA domain-containing protein [Verrucomicrobia bacterium]|nr:VWA domain-containing protein [Verrucomicrobiota bacterium]
MKQSLFSSLAMALSCAISLCTLPACAKPAEVPVGLRVELDRPVLPAGSPQRAVVKVALDSVRLPPLETRPPVNLTLVLDRSGSMHGDKIEHAKAAAIEAVRRLAPDDVFSLVVFDHEVNTLVPATRVGGRRDLEARIRSITARGNTAIYGGVTQGANELRKHLEDRRYTHRMVLLSDGLANNGPSQPEDFARLGAALIREGISVSTVGVGLDYNEDLMTRLARKSDGNTYFVSSSRDLPAIFNAELGDVLSVVARRVVVTIEFPAYVRPLAFVGRDGVIRGRRAEFSLNQLYGGQEKFALVEVEIDGAPAGEECEVAQASVVFEDAIHQRSASLSAKSRVQFSASESAVIVAANRQVQADYATNALMVAKDEAIALADAGKRDQAAQKIRERADDLRKLSEVYSNAAVGQLAAAAAPAAASIEVDGLSNEKRKAFRAEIQQGQSQQSPAGRP